MNTKIHYTEWGKTHLSLLRPLGCFEIGQIEKWAGMGSTLYRLLLEASKAFVPASRVKTVEGMVELDRTVTIEGSIEKHGLARYSLELRPELAASVNPHAGNETCLDLAKAWLEECRRDHKDCGTGAPTRLPSRLLEISQEDSSLVYLREVRGQMGSYAALSYCWGSSASRLKILCNALKAFQRRRNASSQAEAEGETQDMKCDIQDDFDIDIDTEEFYNTDLDEFKRLFNLQKTPETVFDAIKMASSTTASAQRDIMATKSNFDELKRGIDIQRLPRTVLDAIKVASHLSIRYIWVDRLCIIQDDPDDWARESRDMWAVFANALLTISADRSPDVTSGMLHEQTFATVPRKEIQIHDLKALVQLKLPHQHARQELHFIHSDPETEPVDSRAWCFQENLASTRLLHYRAGEMLWECKEHTLCECGRCQIGGYRRDSSFLTRLRSELKAPKVYQRWFDAVMGYSSRVMTRQTDKLPALSGAASKSQDQIIAACGKPDTYLAGLWRGDIVRGLLWCYTEASEIRGHTWTRFPDGPPEHRAGEYRAPTWSWASVDRPVHWWHRLADKFNSAVSIVDAGATPKTDSNPYGEVNSGYILLSGPTYQGLAYRGWEPFMDTLRGSGISASLLEMDEDDEIVLRQGAIDVLLLYVGSACGQGSLKTVQYCLVLKRSLHSAKFRGPIRAGMIDLLSKFDRPYERIGICASEHFRPHSTFESHDDGENDGAEKLDIDWRDWERETLCLI